MPLARAPGSPPGARRFWRACLAAPLAALATLLAACHPLPPADLTILNGPEPSSLDPLIGLGIEELRALQPLFEGLTRSDPVTSRAIPGLADRWTLSADGRTYRFHLRDHATWSTGEPISSADVLYSWRRILEPTNACAYANCLFAVEGAEAFALGRQPDFARVGLHATSPSEFEAVLNAPCAYFLDLCTLPTLAVVPRQTIESQGARWIHARPLPSSGPYQLDFWRLNDRVRLRRNPQYWDAAATTLETVDFLTVTAPNTVINLYLKHQADVIWDKPLVPTELVPALRATPDHHTFPILGTYFLRFNTTRAPYSDARVRRAFALATDKQRVAQRITASGEEPANHMVPTVTANHRRGEGQHHDPEAARRLLAEAGFPGGAGFPPVEILLDGGVGGSARTHERVGVELKSMWESVLGVRVELRRMEKSAFLVAQRGLDYSVSRSSWIGDYNDPMTFLDLFLADNANNRTGWSSPRYDALLRRAGNEADTERRAALLAEAETLLVRDEVPVIPLWFEVGFFLYRPGELAGIHPNPTDIHPINAIRRIAPRR